MEGKRIAGKRKRTEVMTVTALKKRVGSERGRARTACSQRVYNGIGRVCAPGGSLRSLVYLGFSSTKKMSKDIRDLCFDTGAHIR